MKDFNEYNSFDLVETKETTTNEPNGDTKFPLPTHKDVLQNKKFQYNTFATLMINSKFDPNANSFERNFRNYFYKNKMGDIMDFIERLELESKTKIANKKTIQKHIKAIIESGLDLIEVINTEKGIVYKIKASTDNRYYVKIPYIQIKHLLICTNKNMLRLFALLKYMCNETEYKPITRKFISENLGLASNSSRGLGVIGEMVTALANLGFIEIKKVTKTEYKDGKEIVKTYNAYRVTTLDEYKEAKNRGIVGSN